MILGVGIDLVEIDRFEPWLQFSDTKLKRVFLPSEIAYIKANPSKATERLAARFAAKEAFYKALCQLNPKKRIPFLTLCRQVSVISNGPPQLIIDWSNLLPNNYQPKNLQTHISITHTRTIATALVIIEKSVQ